MKKTILVATLAFALATTFGTAVAREKSEKSSPVVATINGEAVTKAEWASIWKADQWHAEGLKKQAGYTEKMQGRPYEDFFFQEEVVKIRAMAQRYQSELPGMKNAIDAIYQKAKAGEDFAELARQYSQDVGTAAHGGDLGGPKEFHEMVFPFNRVALAMKQGQISEPILTIFGYHILRVERILPATPSEGKGRRVEVRNILIRYTSSDPRKEADALAAQAKVEVLDKSMCKKLTSYCPKEG